MGLLLDWLGASVIQPSKYIPDCSHHNQKSPKLNIGEGAVLYYCILIIVIIIICNIAMCMWGGVSFFLQQWVCSCCSAFDNRQKNDWIIFPRVGSDRSIVKL